MSKSAGRDGAFHKFTRRRLKTLRKKNKSPMTNAYIAALWKIGYQQLRGVIFGRDQIRRQTKKLISCQMKNLQTWKSTDGHDTISRQTIEGQIQDLHDLHKFN